MKHHLAQIIVLSVSLIMASSGNAQDCRNPEKYEKAMLKADSLIQASRYSEAYDLYNAARVYCRDSSAEVQEAQDSLFYLIDRQRSRNKSLQISTIALNIKALYPNAAIRLAELSRTVDNNEINTKLIYDIYRECKWFKRILGPWEGKTVTGVLNPDLNQLLIADEDYKIDLWDIESAKRISTYTGHTGTITELAFHPSKAQFFSASADNSIRLWDIPPSGKEQIIFSDALVDSSPNSSRQDINRDPSIVSIAIHPKGTSLVASSETNNILFKGLGSNVHSHIRNPIHGDGTRHVGMSSPIARTLGHLGIPMVAFSPTGDEVMAGTRDDIIYFFDQDGGNLLSGEEIRQIELKGDWTFVNYSKDDKHILAGNEAGESIIWFRNIPRRQFKVYDPENIYIKISIHKERVDFLEFLAKENILVSASADKTIKLWGVESESILHEFALTNQIIHDIKVDRQQKEIFSLGNSLDIRKIPHKKKTEIFTGSSQPTVLHFSPVSKHIAVGFDEIAIVWDHTSNQIVSLLSGHNKAITSLVFMPSYSNQKGLNLVLTGSLDSTAKTWEPNSGNVIKTFTGFKAPIVAIDANNSEDQFCVVDQQGRFVRLDADDIINHERKIEKEIGLPGSPAISSISHSSIDDTFFFGTEDGTILTVGGYEDVRIDTFHKSHNQAITAFDLSHNLLVSADKTISYFKDPTLNPLIFTGHTDTVIYVKYDTLSHNIISLARNKEVIRWDTTGQILNSYELDVESVYTASYNPKCLKILTSSKSPNTLFELRDGFRDTVISAISGYHKQDVSCMDMSQEGTYFLTGSKDHTTLLWEIETQKAIQNFVGHEEALTAVKFVYGTDQILTASLDKTLKLWDTKTGDLLKSQEFSAPFELLTLSDSGNRFLAASTRGTLWEGGIEKMDSAISISLNTGKIIYLDYYDTNRVLALTNRGKIFIWDLIGNQLENSYQLSYTEQELSCATYSHENKELLIGTENHTAQLWQIGIKQANSIRTYSSHIAPISGLAFSPSGKQFISISQDRTVVHWDKKDAQPLEIFRGHKYSAALGIFLPDGKSFIMNEGSKVSLQAISRVPLEEALHHQISTLEQAIEEIPKEDQIRYGINEIRDLIFKEK